jgi:hypothetical protein
MLNYVHISLGSQKGPRGGLQANGLKSLSFKRFHALVLWQPESFLYRSAKITNLRPTTSLLLLLRIRNYAFGYRSRFEIEAPNFRNLRPTISSKGTFQVESDAARASKL